MSLAKEPPMQIEKWSQEDIDQTIAWARGERIELPKPIEEYIARVRKYSD